MVLVTGGTRGIGAACVRWFLERGDRVVATYRSAAAPDTPRRADPEHYLAVRCDVTDPAEVEAAFAEVEQRWGPVEVLVANAGITRDTLVLRMDDAAFDEVIDTNLTGAFRVAKRAVAKMLRLHRGADHLRLLGGRVRRAARSGQLRRLQGRTGGPGPGAGPRGGQPPDHGQRGGARAW